MRELQYAVEGKAANLKTFALDEPGQGGACHKYMISFDNPEVDNHYYLRFQEGPIHADGNGVNGIQHEDLLAIIIDRLEGFQSGPYKSAYNGNALHHLKKALAELQNRTRDRMARNVEGTHEV